MRDFHDDWFFDNPDDFGDFECLGNPRKRTAKKGGSAMNDIDFSPMTLLVLGAPCWLECVCTRGVGCGNSP
jgi:hypothetical protein